MKLNFFNNKEKKLLGFLKSTNFKHLNFVFLLLIIFMVISDNILHLNAGKLKLRSRIKTEATPVNDEKLPLSLNITYENPYHDLDEQKKYAQEHLAFIRKTKEIDDKVSRDYDNLKSIINVQNIQIEKINEIFYTNLAILYQKLANDYASQYKEHKVVRNTNRTEELKKVEKGPLKVDFNDQGSIEQFKNNLLHKGIVKPEYLGDDSGRSKVWMNVMSKKQKMTSQTSCV